MTQIAVLTPDRADKSYIGRWPEVLERLKATLESTGATVTATPWTDHVEDASGLGTYDLILPVIAWGYHRDHGRWLKACATWSAAGLAVANPAEVLRWNSDKTYLARLADRGVPIPPTRWTDRVTQDQVDAAFAETGAPVLIVKPTVSAGAFRTLRLTPGEVLSDAPEGAAMIQPYLKSIETEGETSLLFFGGRVSHAVNKRPVPGDFRIQVQFGGLYRAVKPDAAAMALAQQALAVIDEPLLYARIDMAHDDDGRWVLMEAELIEPDFYLDHDPQKGAGFADAVKVRLEA
ncbi:Glutathione synthase/Ribosomal protein S6 modification enzyme (glutaminyl transferase) [Brevundimonas vesicularis]|uniref:Glutathione synthase/Ribosomal protein S6 modification enzyme (Glutaminyl transferase) n=1 Tax=Brevundimonas vesicularis TaxID=41276 RepID=A0A2X1BD57_BREVE|nr:transporter [Brevundimonas vesicularis]SPU54657.1 Glutathione synthase/Ribosomal protein S6 modification enzyme (glutaminyl transferase) [Brevundimonas vesicularis]